MRVGRDCHRLTWFCCQQCKPEYKVPGLYVIDSIVRQSRHQFGMEKDVFAPRFSKNIISTFQHLYRCPSDDKVRRSQSLPLFRHRQLCKQLLRFCTCLYPRHIILQCDLVLRLKVINQTPHGVSGSGSESTHCGRYLKANWVVVRVCSVTHFDGWTWQSLMFSCSGQSLAFFFPPCCFMLVFRVLSGWTPAVTTGIPSIIKKCHHSERDTSSI